MNGTRSRSRSKKSFPDIEKLEIFHLTGLLVGFARVLE